MMLIHVFILAGSPSHGRAWSWSGFQEVADEDSDKDEAVAFAAHAPRDAAGLPKKRASRPPGKTATHLFRPLGISRSICPEKIFVTEMTRIYRARVGTIKTSAELELRSAHPRLSVWEPGRGENRSYRYDTMLGIDASSCLRMTERRNR
jgi:hypothetical protein